MPITIYNFDMNKFINNHEVFPPDIPCFNRLMYHGTNSFFSNDIELNGFQTNVDIVNIEDIRNLIEILRSINLQSQTNCLQVLENHVNKHFTVTGNLKRISFALTSCRCLNYASQEFAGGQIVRSVRDAFNHIKNNISDVPKRLQDTFKNLEQIQNNVFTILNNNCNGVIYAINVTNDLIDNLEMDAQRTIQSRISIPSHNIVGKTIINPEITFSHDQIRECDVNQFKKIESDRYSLYRLMFAL